MKSFITNNKTFFLIGFLLIIGLGFLLSQIGLTIESKELMQNGKYNLTATSNLGYGNKKDQVGVIFAPESSAIGPTSFAVDSEEQLYICDGVNNRIQVKSIKREQLKQIPLDTGSLKNKDIFPFDIAVIGSDLVIVYDEVGKLYQLDSEGNLKKSIKVDTNQWSVKMEMHKVGNNIYMQCVDQIDHLIGVIENNRLRIPTNDEKEHHKKPGIHGESGRRYLAGLDRWEKGWIEVFEPDDEPGFTIELPVPGIVSVKFLGEDENENIYIQVEWTEEVGVNLEVHIFNSQGESIDVLKIPDNHYHYWTVKLLSVDEKGNIHQLLPLEDRVELNTFQSSSN